MDDVAGFKVGMELKADLFKVGEQVRVTGVTKGKGFQGVMKRWGFRGGPDGHGGCSHRRPGSIGQCAYPGRVWKNKRMAGHTGAARMTVRNLKVVKVDAENNLIAVKGAVPGHAERLRHSTRTVREEDTMELEVVNSSGQSSGKITLPDERLQREDQETPGLRSGQVLHGQSEAGDGDRQDQERGQGQRQEALEAEGAGQGEVRHRGQPGLGRWRRCARAAAARLTTTRCPRRRARAPSGRRFRTRPERAGSRSSRASRSASPRPSGRSS